jgi:dGTPase
MNWHQLLSSQRWNAKPDLAESSRSAFEQDYDRIIFSHPFRRLQDKTQVHPIPEQDFVHTRLTHSLEVSSVGRSLGKKIGEHVLQRHPELKENFSLFDFGAIVAAASLAHDLGNPPFGHAGEEAISDFFLHHPKGQSFQNEVNEGAWNDLIKFEGNAQGFRLLNKSEYGLKLTFATLGTFTKYPCPSFFFERDKKKKSQKKFGFFQTEEKVFAEVANQLGLIKTGENAWARHPLAFLVEAADDICYSIIDLEDGCRLGLVNFEETVEMMASILQTQFDRQKLDRLHSLNGKLGVLRAMAINRLLDECTTAFLDFEASILEGKFDQALTDIIPSQVVEIEAAGHEVLPGLLHEFIEAGFHYVKGGQSRKHANLALMLPEEILSNCKQSNGDTYLILREIIDFVSGLTDRHALSLYRKIKGFSVQ